MDGVVVAVPKKWGTATDPCGEPNADTVWFRDTLPSRMGCGATPITGDSSVTIASKRSGVIPLAKHVDLGARVNGLQVTSSGVACKAEPKSPCELTFVVAGADAVFDINYRGKAAKAAVRHIFESVTRLPSGQTTVPLIHFGTSVEEAKQELSDAGLEGQSPDVDFPHYATGTNPPVGAVVDQGDVVEITIGDG